MKKHTLWVFAVVLFPLTASADVTAKVQELMKAQGQLEIWQQQIELGRIEGRKQADKMLEQFLSQLNPSEEFQERFKLAANRFINNMQNHWTAEQIVAVWAKYYAPHFTESELDQLIAFYKSDIGQKDVWAGKAAAVEFARHFSKENEGFMKNAVNEYVADLRIVAKECNCKRVK